MTRLELSIHGLERRAPELSARRILSSAQRRLFLLALLLVTTLLVLALPVAAIALVAFGTALYVATFLGWLQLTMAALKRPAIVSVSDAEAYSIADDDLPIYTVLVPAYKEPEVIHRTIAALEALVYPTDRLDIRLLLEEDDLETIEAVRAAAPPPHMQLVVVPVAQPRTKPKACNYGLTASRGEIVTIYDAEDRPEPLQLRRAVAAFRRVDGSVGCLQARLSYFNAHQNLLTRWFTVEYASWFMMLLPALASGGGPVPLGGTSMHIRRAVFEAIGAWDPYNVTEDADFGVRLYRSGWRTSVLESITYEEANSDFVNWIKQRSHWHKGYLVTWLVHMRQPARLWRELGAAGFFRFNVLIGGTPLIVLLNPIFWLITILWFTLHPAFVQALFPPWIFYPGLTCMVAGNFFVYFAGVVTTRMTGHPRLVGAALLAPFYWTMMSVAAVKAVVQLVYSPSKWEKTVHGLDLALQKGGV
jgi:cellulose synthase/poly-beta-1,6-N-acetylglucosamine synthase-like glycosyltransferase